MSTLENTLDAPKIEKAATGQIRTIQDMWAATITYFEEGLYDTEAMYKVYRRMSAKLTYQDLANVFSGVYAETYWSFTLMDASILSKSLQSALALGSKEANYISATAIKQWRGVLSRNNINDMGAIPVQGSYTSSIDIVCNQNTEIPSAALINNWNSTYWAQPQVGKNYVYIRCQNLQFTGELTPTVYMFYTSGGFNQPPTAWQQLFTSNDPNDNEGDVILIDGKAGPMELGVRGVSEAFLFEPTSTGHVCIIGMAKTKYFTNPTQIPAGNWSGSEWITHNGAAAWHNVNPQIALVDSLKFYNQDDSVENFVFKVQCRNVPVGSTISLSSEDSAANFTTGNVLIKNTSETIKLPVTLPPNYEGDLKVKLEDPDGNLLPSNAAVEITMEWVLDKNHKDYLNAINGFGGVDSFSREENAILPLGSYTIHGIEEN